MADVKSRRPAPAAYDAGFHAWSRDRAARLRGPRPSSIDRENLAEAVESFGRSGKSAIENRLGALVLHLKWLNQADHRTSGGKATIVEQRKRIARSIAASPGSGRHPETALAEECGIARLKAADGNGLPEETFPAAWPFTAAPAPDPDFRPEAPAR